MCVYSFTLILILIIKIILKNSVIHAEYFVRHLRERYYF